MFVHTEQCNSFNSSHIEMMNLNLYGIPKSHGVSNNAEIKDKRKIRNYFTPEEDQKLRDLVLKYGDRSWNLVSSLMKTRNQRQCRERWKHYLSCDVKEASQPWTKEEDQILLQKYNELGAKWTKIARDLPGRSDLQVKNRYMKNLKNKKTSSIEYESDESESNDEYFPENKNIHDNQITGTQLQKSAEQEKNKQQPNAESILSTANSNSIFNDIDLGLGFDILPSNMITELCQDDQDLFQGFDNEFLNWSFE